jgi:four helix bundle protein
MAFRFEGLEIWQLAKAFADRVCTTTAGFPRKEDYALTSQLNRAAYSVVLNIAEGSGRGTNAEFNHFLGIAVGSVFEVAAGLHLAKEQRYIDEQAFASLYEDADKLGRKINAFRKTLGTSQHPPNKR